MRLKRLEAYGFKSFAEKIEVEFDSGITAVVGPNGSGKSNITDAIKWILGEQNIRNLRGTKSEDVIFKGSSTRRALGIAEASLTFINENDLPVPYEEVVITRRLFRSGESEFFINKGRCRLKDIHLLLADTGLGRDGVSVIGQNHIDNILNSRPEERRLFFEETAGITKYKSRKNEAVRRLEETEANLLRVNDILKEISDRLGPLFEQAEKTKRYRELEQRLFSYKVTELCRRHEAAEHDLQGQKQLLEASSDLLIATEAELHKLEASEQEAAAEVLRYDGLLQEHEKAGNELNQELEAKRQARAVLEERKRQGQLRREQSLEQKKGLQDNYARLEEEKTEVTRQLEECLQQCEETKQLLCQKKSEAGLHSEDLRVMEKEIFEGQRHLNAVSEALAEKKEELLLLEQESGFSQNRHDEELRLIAAWQDEAKEKQAAFDEYKGCLDACLAEQQLLQKKTEAMKLERAQLQGVYRADGEAIDSLKADIHQVKAKLELLTKLQEAYDGFGRAVKAVLQSKEVWRSEICGAVAELLSTKKEYTRALSVALGGSQENIVTRSVETAKRAIVFLKNIKAGRSTFLPLPALRHNLKSRGIISGQGVIGYLNQLVEVDEQYRIVADHLLGRTLLVDTLDNALRVAKRENYSLRIVTLEGELLNPGGSLSGGYLRLNENSYLNRRAEIEAATGRLEKFQVDYQALTNKLRLSEERAEALDNQIKLLEQQQAQNNVSIAEHSLQAAQMEKTLEELADNIRTVEERIKTGGESFAAIQNKITLVKRSWKELNTQKEQLELELTAKEKLAVSRRNKSAELAKAVNEVELQHTVLEQNNLRFREIILLHKKEISRIEQELVEVTEGIELLLAEGSKADIEMENLGQIIHEYQNTLNEHKLKVDMLYQKRMEYLSEQQSLISSQRDVRAKVAEIQGEMHKLDLQKSKMQFVLDQCEKELEESFKLDYQTACSHCIDLPNGELQHKLRNVKDQIETLGNVNLNAVEEYEETRARHDFLNTQLSDLTEAKNNLDKLIKEMDNVMTVRFRDAFQKIRGFFHETFQVLFGGGSADVFLTDENDILHSGVNITVQVPDKKAQNLIALSGGERSLTVVALLLAFLRYKPAPFSVLDEIDAALDEANIVRFASYIKEFSRKTQFIIVTHRKGTMMTADVMYGVTMEVPGVSKIISVHMKDAQ